MHMIATTSTNPPIVPPTIAPVGRFDRDSGVVVVGGGDPKRSFNTGSPHPPLNGYA